MESYVYLLREIVHHVVTITIINPSRTGGRSASKIVGRQALGLPT